MTDNKYMVKIELDGEEKLVTSVTDIQEFKIYPIPEGMVKLTLAMDWVNGQKSHIPVYVYKEQFEKAMEGINNDR